LLPLATGYWLLTTNYWFLTPLALLSGCSPTYVLRAGYEEAKILWSREPIEDVLRRPNLDEDRREKLELVLRVRRFAAEELGFRVGGSYTSLSELTTPPILSVVSAAPHTSLEPYTWWFPIVGQVAYKGYFDAASAKREASRLEAKGYDTYIRSALAFSTLGWFADPLLSHLLRYDSETLTNIIIHELLHNTFYLAGQTAFNESLANFAGHRGAIAFFAKEQGNGSDAVCHAVESWESELAVSQFVGAATDRLKALYASPLTEEEKLRQKAELFARLQEEFRSLPGRVRQNADFASVSLNNAVMLQYLVYLQELALFERVYQQNGQDLRATLTQLIETAKEDEDDPFAAVRTLAGASTESLPPAQSCGAQRVNCDCMDRMQPKALDAYVSGHNGTGSSGSVIPAEAGI
jgi:predicted aminopeptidase